MVTFFFSDLDLDFPEDGIYCLEKTWEQDPAMCRAVLEGSLEGWRYAFAHPDEALEIVITRMKQQKVCANRAHQRWMLARMRDIILDGSSVPRGVLRRGDYERTKATLLGNGFIWAAPEYTEFYKGPAQ
jgi:NitT/TauT family transport system substrate-binding protein